MQFGAIRNSFADQWQPNGGIESAMIDMMTIAFSLQMYWSQVAHRRLIEVHNSQEKELGRYENQGWKSPYQHEAGAIDQAYKLADGYNGNSYERCASCEICADTRRSSFKTRRTS